MPVKTTVINRWEVLLEGDASAPVLFATSIDGDEKRVKITLGTVERIIPVEDWIGFVNAVQGKVKYTATR